MDREPSIYLYNEILNDINTMSWPFKVNSNTIELTVHISWYCVLDILCVILNDSFIIRILIHRVQNKIKAKH